MAAKLTQTVTLINPLGLHARPASKLVQLCQQFDARIELQQDGKTADATSVLALLMLASGQGKTVSVHTTGRQAEEALLAVIELIESGFDEN